MKKAIRYIAVLLLMVSFTACDDFLTQTSPDELTSDSYWRDKDDVESAMAAAYSQLYFAYYSGDAWDFAEIKWPVEAYRQDDVDMGQDAQNYPNWVQLRNFSYTNGNSQFTYYWKSYYRGISYANQIITKVGGMSSDQISDTDRARYTAEARFLRGFYHMQLLLNWQQIIVRDTYITSTGQLNKSLSTREEAWQFIVDDLKAAQSLPQSYGTDNIGRATSGAASAYLGFAYLTMASEQTDQKTELLNSAVEAFNNVTGYELVKDFASMFNGTNKNSKESIFEIQFTLSDANGADYTTQLHRWIGTAEFGGWDEILPSDRLMSEFRKEGKTANDGLYDARLYASVYFQDPYYNDGTGKVYGYDWDAWLEMMAGEVYDRPAFRKLMPATYESLKISTCDINVPLMRYANVLLMKAEALNDLGRTSEAVTLINQVRDVHGNMPAMTGTTQTEVQAQIEHERMIEFPLENYRWYDLRRWGKTAEAMQAAGRTGYDSSKLFYPVPQTEVNANGSL